MRSMKNSDLAEKKNTDTRAFTFADFRAQGDEKGFNFRPANGAADRPGENLRQCSLMLSLHAR